MIIMSLADELTDKNIESYVRAGIDVAHKIIALTKEGYRNSLIPSRGVFPLITIANTYLDLHKERVPYIIDTVLPFTSTDLSGISQSDMRTYWAKVYNSIKENRESPKKQNA